MKIQSKSARKITDRVFEVGVRDWDRRLFDELIPLPDGTSYNSYIVKGSEKTVLIDTVNPNKGRQLIANLKSTGITKIDYIIAHHGEQDHSGSIPKVLKHYADAKIVTNAKCADELQTLLLVPQDKFIIIEDEQTLSLGDRTLRFIFYPWVHWPETFLTYLEEEQILFTCDFLGSHLATSHLFSKDDSRTYKASKRYYAEIMMSFRKNIVSKFNKLTELKLKYILPSHGPLHDNPQWIIDCYKDWTSDKVKNEVVLAYVSMHGSVKVMAEYFIDKLISEGITVKPFNISVTDIGELAMDLVDAATIVIGSPTVLAGAHPLAMYAGILANALRPKTRFVSVIGSYAWGGKMVDKIAGLLPNLKIEILEPVLSKGYPVEEDYRALDKLVETIKQKHKELGLL